MAIKSVFLPQLIIHHFIYCKDDLALFEQYSLQELCGADEKYTYVFNRDPADIDEPSGEWWNEENAYHEMMIELAKKHGIGYRRWKNE